jgi:hypothetical protein
MSTVITFHIWSEGECMELPILTFSKRIYLPHIAMGFNLLGARTVAIYGVLLVTISRKCEENLFVQKQFSTESHIFLLCNSIVYV